jgi:hypothetical protein
MVVIPAGAGFAPDGVFNLTKAGPGIAISAALALGGSLMVCWLFMLGSRGVRRWAQQSNLNALRRVRDTVAIVATVLVSAFLPGAVVAGALSRLLETRGADVHTEQSVLDQLPALIIVEIGPIALAFALLSLLVDSLLSYRSFRRAQDRAWQHEFGQVDEPNPLDRLS